MKNLKIYKKSLAILSAVSLVLFSGCSETKTKENKEVKKEKSCEHLVEYFKDEPIIFEECRRNKIMAIVDSDEENLKIFRKKRWRKNNYM